MMEVLAHNLDESVGSSLTDGVKIRDIPGWDSLAWIRVLNGIQEHFSIEVDIEDVADVETIGDLNKVIKGKLISLQ